MKKKSKMAAGVALVLAAMNCLVYLTAQAQGTAFTYQGQLSTNGAPANGNFDVSFALFATNSGGTAIAGVTNLAVGVTNGLFTTVVDFGPGAFTGQSNWVELAVRTNGAQSFPPSLAPRQLITPAPYTIFAESANASNLVGSIPATNLSGVAMLTGGNSFTGQQTVTSGNIAIGGQPIDQTALGIAQTGPVQLDLLKSGERVGYQINVEPSGLDICEELIACGRLFIQNGTGNIGIGTTAPVNLLDVRGPADFIFGGVGIGTLSPTSSLSIGQQGMPQLDLYKPGQSIGYQMNVETNGLDICEEGVSCDRLFMQNGTGYIGINTGSPLNLLDVRGPADFFGHVGIGTFTPTNALDVQGSADFTGNVGIGTDAPVDALDVHGTAHFTGDVGFGTISPDRPVTVQGIGSGGEWISLKETNGVTQWHINNAHGGLDIVQTGVADGRLFFSANGCLGINTTSPSHGALEVNGNLGSFPFTSADGWNNSSNAQLVNFVPGTGESAIYANGNIVSTFAYFLISDERVKNIIGRSDAARDLDTLRGIEVTDYRYKDVMAHGNGTYKKVIAQQVEKVFPQAVTKRIGEVPDIYKRATIADGWVQLATDLKVGEQVKLIGDKEEGIYRVLEVRGGAFRTDFKPASGKVFVYGRQVDDFRTVDYDAIAMLNVSATQELARRTEEQTAENAELKARVGALEKEMTGLRELVTRVAQEKETRQADNRMASTAESGSRGGGF